MIKYKITYIYEKAESTTNYVDSAGLMSTIVSQAVYRLDGDFKSIKVELIK